MILTKIILFLLNSVFVDCNDYNIKKISSHFISFQLKTYATIDVLANSSQKSPDSKLSTDDRTPPSFDKQRKYLATLTQLLEDEQTKQRDLTSWTKAMNATINNIPLKTLKIFATHHPLINPWVEAKELLASTSDDQLLKVFYQWNQNHPNHPASFLWPKHIQDLSKSNIFNLKKILLIHDLVLSDAFIKGIFESFEQQDCVSNLVLTDINHFLHNHSPQLDSFDAVVTYFSNEIHAKKIEKMMRKSSIPVLALGQYPVTKSPNVWTMELAYSNHLDYFLKNIDRDQKVIVIYDRHHESPVQELRKYFDRFTYLDVDEFNYIEKIDEILAIPDRKKVFEKFLGPKINYIRRPNAIADLIVLNVDSHLGLSVYPYLRLWPGIAKSIVAKNTILSDNLHLNKSLKGLHMIGPVQHSDYDYGQDLVVILGKFKNFLFDENYVLEGKSGSYYLNDRSIKVKLSLSKI